jgi:hypothetical protein
MMMGLPVLMSPGIGDTEEIALREEAAIFVKPGENPKNVLANMQRSYGSEQIRQFARERISKYAKLHLSHGSVLGEVVIGYERAISAT